jgi:hypothetical protein
VHFERLVIEAGDDTFSLDLHRRMTVIAGVGPLEREGLVTELLGALGRGRSGVHLEIATDAGDRYAIFRPAGARHRVVDTEAAADVTDQFMTGEHLDVLERAGLHRSTARRHLCMQPSDLVTRTRVEEYVLALARIDQGRLWDVSDRVKERERHLAETAAAAGSDAEDAVMFEEIERRHRAFEAAQAAHEQVRYLSFMIGAGAALVGVCASVLWGFWAATPFLLLAIAATALTRPSAWMSRVRIEAVAGSRMTTRWTVLKASSVARIPSTLDRNTTPIFCYQPSQNKHAHRNNRLPEPCSLPGICRSA